MGSNRSLPWVYACPVSLTSRRGCVPGGTPRGRYSAQGPCTKHSFSFRKMRFSFSPFVNVTRNALLLDALLFFTYFYGFPISGFDLVEDCTASINVEDPWHFGADPDLGILTVPLTNGSGSESYSFLQWLYGCKKNIFFLHIFLKLIRRHIIFSI